MYVISCKTSVPMEITETTTTETIETTEEKVATETTVANTDNYPDKTYMLKLADVVTPDDPLTLGLIELKEQVEKRTNGNFKMEVFPSGQLGESDDVDDQIRMGAEIASITDIGRLSSKVPEIAVLNGPYLVNDISEFESLFNLDFYKEILQKLENEHNMKILAFNFYQGERNMLTKVPIYKPEDLNGLKIRTIGTDIWLSTVKAMGAEPVSMPWSEAYNGIQQKVIDGVEVQHAAAVGSRLYEVAGYYSKTGHIQLITALVINPDVFYGLPEEYQEILIEESKKAGDYTTSITLKNTSDYEKIMQDNGMELIEPDIELFKQATEKVYDELGLGDLKDLVDTALGSN